MLLITMREWFGPQARKMSREEYLQQAPEVRTRGFVTALPLGTALARIHAYERAYKERYRLAVEFALLAVTTIDDLTDEEIEFSRAVHIEKLAQRAEDF